MSALLDIASECQLDAVSVSNPLAIEVRSIHLGALESHNHFLRRSESELLTLEESFEIRVGKDESIFHWKYIHFVASESQPGCHVSVQPVAVDGCGVDVCDLDTIRVNFYLFKMEAALVN